jgi:hypothetical protein
MQVTKLIHAGLDRLGLAHPSQDYRLKKRVRLIDLIDGRLEKFGVWEHFVPGATSDNAKCLTDGDGHLWVHAGRNGSVESITIYGDSDNGSILAAIGKAFNTEIFSAFELEYWGYDTLLRASEQAGAMQPHDPASGHRKVELSADLAREAEKFGVELQGFISAEPVR